mmetsp:Transcript_11913/g.19903  ORF Transcript_11913/g.19903 Transcript_11913/m.19903 type:complete len:385 (-) Transcript_11913:1852-3006(-)
MLVFTVQSTLLLLAVLCKCGSRVDAFNIMDYTHYIDYIPSRVEGIANFEDFRTAGNPPSHLRNRKMEIGGLKLGVEDVLANPVWPSRWPYGFEDFRPLDYTRDDVINTGPQYEYSQSLIEADHLTIIPGIFRLPIRRHFVMPKDKFAFSEHIGQHLFDGANVLELFSCYDSLLPPGIDLGLTVGVGWYNVEMQANAALDDYIVQDLSVDPFLPLASNYFDFVIVPAMFQLFQRPLDMFQEINRVLKPGGRAIIGVKLSMWSFLAWKQGRYYVETNYLEDVLALGSFFHYAEGYTKPQAYDLTLPELNVVGQLKDVLFPNPRADFYACVEAKKKKKSPHGKPKVGPDDINGDGENNDGPLLEGMRYRPKLTSDPNTVTERLSPYY